MERDNSECEQILGESIVMATVTLFQVMHPEYGEVVVIQDDGEINSANKIKMFELAKIKTGYDMMKNME